MDVEILTMNQVMELIRETEKELNKNWSVTSFGKNNFLASVNFLENLIKRNKEAHERAFTSTSVFLLKVKPLFGKDVVSLIGKHLWDTRCEPHVWKEKTFLSWVKQYFI